MDAIEILEHEHKGAKKLMEDISKSSGPEKKKLFYTLKHELEMHDHIEESIFYPSVRTHSAVAGLAVKDKEAHQAVEAALAQLAVLPVEDANWAPSFNAMRERLLKHVADEEGNIFVKIRKELSATELADLGVKMKAGKITQAKAA